MGSWQTTWPRPWPDASGWRRLLVMRVSWRLRQSKGQEHDRVRRPKKHVCPGELSLILLTSGLPVPADGCPNIYRSKEVRFAGGNGSVWIRSASPMTANVLSGSSRQQFVCYQTTPVLKDVEYNEYRSCSNKSQVQRGSRPRMLQAPEDVAWLRIWTSSHRLWSLSWPQRRAIRASHIPEPL